MQLKDDILRQFLLERKRLKIPPSPDEKATGVWITRFIVHHNSSAVDILNLAKEVMVIVNKYATEEWPSLEQWFSILPEAFVKNCSPELTKKEEEEQVAEWYSMSCEEKIKITEKNRPWSLSDWLYWMEPEERQWFWWNAILDDSLKNKHFFVEATGLDDPFLWGALKWLFRACGAVDVVSEDDL